MSAHLLVRGGVRPALFLCALVLAVLFSFGQNATAVAQGRYPLPEDHPDAQLPKEFRNVPEVPLLTGDGPISKAGGVSTPMGISYSIKTRRVRKHRIKPERQFRNADEPVAPSDSEVMRTSKDAEVATIFPPDGRSRVPTTQLHPWRTQCKVYATFPDNTVVTGSGTLISRRNVITAGHCIYVHEKGGWARSVRVVPGLNGTYQPYGSVNGRSVYSFSDWTSYKKRSGDMGVITLASTIGDSTGWLGYAGGASVGSVNIAGYDGDLFGGLALLHRFGPIDRNDGLLLYYRLDAMRGSSGAATYIYNSATGQRTVVGVNSFESSTTNGACYLTASKSSAIQSLIASGN